MQHSPQPDFTRAELDAALLSTPFKTHTRWHVIAGAPSSGKSTLVAQLAERGYRTIPETARVYIEAEIEKGRTIEAIRADQAALQRILIDRQVEVERGLDAHEFLILDRGVPDHFGYCRDAGMDPNEFLVACFHHRYAGVFLLAPLSFELDGARDRDAPKVSFFDEWTARDYAALGYEPVWAGTLPLRMAAGEALAADDLGEGIEVPGYVRELVEGLG